jgi:hypothetical protein
MPEHVITARIEIEAPPAVVREKVPPSLVDLKNYINFLPSLPS